MKTRNPRCVMIGTTSVGKTTLVHYAINGTKTDSTRPTTAALFSHFETREFPIRQMDIWDTAGMEQYQSLNSEYFKGANGAILVFDITNFQSFEKLEPMYKDLLSYARSVPIIAVAANKCDRRNEAEEVTQEEIETWCKAHGCQFFYTSAITGENVMELFDHMARLLPEEVETVSSVSLEDNAEVIKHCC
ncbi:small GTP-binding protein, putative [Trichomonas vaginalis G3]|uniref:Small GTP-binding protein, putative n=1 Tax=Trichomonas vaginalis (strain ATCC PRA-98 / G3) TaxID=412133 RepID=A2E476_TRIV3|nr:GTPase protein [Trichomonas vaginalis G3]EAY12522.1 small GTP-binding protein, putative [Trichomonas vaginalis G3]KAI5554059.1 GTPase protein [Trichomonas vaginalis G3]|eukprot:XP_001324745.1 small GTP-binding protein [Trichomonas vaginalis G3]